MNWRHTIAKTMLAEFVIAMGIAMLPLPASAQQPAFYRLNGDISSRIVWMGAVKESSDSATWLAVVWSNELPSATTSVEIAFSVSGHWTTNNLWAVDIENCRESTNGASTNALAALWLAALSRTTPDGTFVGAATSDMAPDFARGYIVVAFTNAQPSQALDLVASFGHTIRGVLPGFIYLVNVPVNEELDAITNYVTSEIVKSASVDGIIAAPEWTFPCQN